MMKKNMLAAIVALAAFGLSACSNSADEPAPVQNEDVAPVPQLTEEAPPPAETSASPSPAATPATLNSAEEAPPEEARAPDEQMMEDADVTGMTARASRDEEPPEATPAEQK